MKKMKLYSFNVKHNNTNYNEVFGGEGEDFEVDGDNNVHIVAKDMKSASLMVGGDDNILSITLLGTVYVDEEEK